MDLQIIPLDSQDHFLIYRPLLGLAFVGNRAMVQRCQQYAAQLPALADQKHDEAFEFLASEGFFLVDVKPASPDRIQSTAVLLLTNQCQLRCVYCYAAAGEFIPKRLSFQSGAAAIDFACEQAQLHQQTKFHVDFHGGGEPTLEWQLLKQFTEYTRAKSLPADISITSNAVWSESQCDWLVQNINKVSVSMDGSPATQDHQRPFQNHSPTSELVMTNLHRLDAAGFSSYGIRMTVCPPWDQLADNVKFILENTKCRSVQVEPAFNLERGAHVRPGEDEYSLYAKAYLDAFDVAQEFGVNLRYSGARPGVMSGTFCSAPYNAIIVNPENDIVACYEIVNSGHPLAEISTFGKIQDGVVAINEAKRQHFHTLLEERFEKTCQSCYCRWSCAGDCYTRAFSEPEGYLAASVRCEMNRQITKNILLSLVSRNNGVWHTFVMKKETQAGQ